MAKLMHSPAFYREQRIQFFTSIRVRTRSCLPYGIPWNQGILNKVLMDLAGHLTVKSQTYMYGKFLYLIDRTPLS